MARGRKAADIDGKIAEAQEKVVRAKAGYDRACRELEALIEKRDAMRKDELWKAVSRSDLTYAEILEMIGRPRSGEAGQRP